MLLSSFNASTYRPRDKESVSAGLGRAGEMLRLGVSLAAASLGKGASWRAWEGEGVMDGPFEHPAPLRPFAHRPKYYGWIATEAFKRLLK
jgi:hypothetical protein